MALVAAATQQAFSTNRMMIFSNLDFFGTAMSLEFSIIMDTKAIYGFNGRPSALGIAQGARRLHGQMELAVIEGDGVLELAPKDYKLFLPPTEGFYASYKANDGKNLEITDEESYLANRQDGGTVTGVTGLTGTSTGASGNTISTGLGVTNDANYARDPDIYSELVTDFFMNTNGFTQPAVRPTIADQISNIRLQMYINRQDGRLWSRGVSGITPTRHNISASMDNLFNESMQFIFTSLQQWEELVAETSNDGTTKKYNARQVADTTAYATPDDITGVKGNESFLEKA